MSDRLQKVSESWTCFSNCFVFVWSKCPVLVCLKVQRGSCFQGTTTARQPFSRGCSRKKDWKHNLRWVVEVLVDKRHLKDLYRLWILKISARYLHDIKMAGPNNWVTDVCYCVIGGVLFRAWPLGCAFQEIPRQPSSRYPPRKKDWHHKMPWICALCKPSARVWFMSKLNCHENQKS